MNAPAHLPADPAIPRRAPMLVLAGCAAALLLLAVATVLARDPGSDDDIVVGGPTTTSTDPELSAVQRAHVLSDTADAPAPVDPDVQLIPPGPYRDGQRITVSVPSSMQVDFVNGARPQLCSVVTVEGGTGGIVSCDPLDMDASEVQQDQDAPRSSIEVRLGRRALTPLGERDCGDEAVRCHLVVGDGDGTPHASAALQFTGEAAQPEVTLAVEFGNTPGSFVLRPNGLAPDSSWLELREQQPGHADDLPPLWLSVCAFGAGNPAVAFNGAALWDEVSSFAHFESAPLLGRDCASIGATPVTIDPDRPDAPLELSITGELLGSTWTDCRARACFALISRTTVAEVTPATVVGDNEVVAAALLPLDPTTPLAPRPSLKIVEPGPFVAGQGITVEVRNLPEHYETRIGVCNTDRPFGCVYSAGLVVGDGDLQIVLHERIVRVCGLDDCYLEISSAGKDAPPPATVALPIASP